MHIVPKTTDWKLLKEEFDAMVREESVDTESIETIFDAQFRRRFSELIDRVAGDQHG